jgi:hypothetical protein
MPQLENLIKQTILEALPEFGMDELCALLAARIEHYYLIINRDELEVKKRRVRLQGQRLPESADIAE